MYKDLIKKLSKVKDENDMTDELLGQLLSTFINASTQLIENEEPDIPYEEALNISRASALRIYDQAIFQAKLSDLEDFDD